MYENESLNLLSLMRLQELSQTIYFFLIEIKLIFLSCVLKTDIFSLPL